MAVDCGSQRLMPLTADVKGTVPTQATWPNWMALMPSFSSMKWLGVFLLPWSGLLVTTQAYLPALSKPPLPPPLPIYLLLPIHTHGWRGTVRVKGEGSLQKGYFLSLPTANEHFACFSLWSARYSHELCLERSNFGGRHFETVISSEVMFMWRSIYLK